MSTRGYKGSKPEQQTRRLAVLNELIERAAPYLALEEKQRTLLASSDHLLDALVCSLIARAALHGLLLEIPGELRERATVEGWIALPRRD